MESKFSNTVELSFEQSRSIVKKITESELEMAIRDLKSNKATGADQISNEQIKNAPKSFKLRMLQMFNRILDSGYCPETWKAGQLALILKK